VKILLTGITIVFAGGIALLRLASPLWYQLGITLVVIALLAYTLVVIWYLRFSTREWKYRTSDDSTVLYPYSIKGKAYLWRSKQNQKLSDFCEIDLGRERYIKKVHFSCGCTSEAPIKSRFWFYKKDGNYSFPYGSQNPYIELPVKGDYFESTTRVNLNKPIKAQRIRIQIVEPDIDYLWKVEAVYITIKTPIRLSYTIGKCFLDKL